MQRPRIRSMVARPEAGLLVLRPVHLPQADLADPQLPRVPQHLAPRKTTIRPTPTKTAP